jgi:hypothetical protein
MTTQPIRTNKVTEKAALRGKFIATSANIKNAGRYQINNLMLLLKLLGK